MTRNEKKAVIESMAEKFMNIDDLEGKSMTIMVMSAYAEGKAAGKAEERRRWEQKEAGAVHSRSVRAKKKDNHCSGRPCDKSRGGRCDKKRELAVATV